MQLICIRSLRLAQRMHNDNTEVLLYSCEQFSALPGALTGREVLQMYARLRGVPSDHIEHTVQDLLQRIDLTEYADRHALHRSCAHPYSRSACLLMHIASCRKRMYCSH